MLLEYTQSLMIKIIPFMLFAGLKQYPNNFKKCLKIRQEIISDINKILSNDIIYKKEDIKRTRKQDKSGKVLIT